MSEGQQWVIHMEASAEVIPGDPENDANDAPASTDQSPEEADK